MSDGLLTSFQQGVYEMSATKKHRYGTLRINCDGTKYRYAKAGGTVVAGKACCAAAGVAEHTAEVVAAAGACSAGVKEITFTVAAAAVTAGQYDDGLLIIYDGTAGSVGHKYRISSHGVSAAGSEAITVRLRDPIRTALIATDTWSLVPNPWSSVTHIAAVANMFAGIAPIAVTSGYYFWAQTGGEAVALYDQTTTVGTLGAALEVAVTAGALKCAEDYLGGVVGQIYGGAAVDTKYNAVFLTHG
jgi:hypothetical protein